jgi:uncharacterized protein YqgQ
MFGKQINSEVLYGASITSHITCFSARHYVITDFKNWNYEIGMISIGITSIYEARLRSRYNDWLRAR